MSRSCLVLIRLGVAVVALLWLVGPAGAEDACLQDAALVAGAAVGDDSGIGGTGFAGDDSGDDSGIGGTGIYGTITNFGSLCVNGLRVRYADDVAVEINGRTAQADRLAVGQVAWVEAFGRGDELSAETISILSAAIGVVEALEPHERRLRVNRELIEVPERAIVLDASGRERSDLSGLSAGDIVDVSGLRRSDGHIVASRIESATEAEAADFDGLDLSDLLRPSRRLRRFSIEGYLGPREGPGRFRLDGVEIDASSLSDVRGIEVDARVWLTGARVGDAKLRVHRIRVHRAGVPVGRDSAVRESPGAAAGASGPESPGATSDGLDSPGMAEKPPTDDRVERKPSAAPPAPPSLPDLPEPVDTPLPVDRPVERPDRPERTMDFTPEETLRPDRLDRVSP
jgi:hypothetical protein